jgi:DNA processing protein
LGPPENIFSASRQELRRVINDKAIDLLLETDNSKLIDAAYAWQEKEEHHILTLADPAYPQALLDIPDPPALLYVRGRYELLNCKAFAIVGSRNPTPQGEHNAESFAASLTEAGFLITSGLALGIDAAAHRGALASNGRTVAFIGTGIDRIYPARNKELAIAIATTGAIVSEFPLGTPAIAANFPRRNRLISGFSLGALVVEATTESGSLITARLAGEQGREVFAIPGSIHSPQSRGCHKLIKQGVKLVETVEDILEEFDWARSAPPLLDESPTDKIPGGKSPLDSFLDIMGFDPCDLDELVIRTDLPAESLFPTLLQLELEGRIASLPGGRYQRTPE